MNRYTLLAALWLSVTGYAQQTSFSFCFDGNKKDEKALQITKQQVCLVNKRDTDTTYSRHLI